MGLHTIGNSDLMYQRQIFHYYMRLRPECPLDHALVLIMPYINTESWLVVHRHLSVENIIVIISQSKDIIFL